MKRRRRQRITWTTVALIGIIALVVAVSVVRDRTGLFGSPVASAHRHVEQFQALADEHGDRAAGSPGYEAAARYVEGQLQRAGYETSRDYFTYGAWNEDSQEEEDVESFSVIAETAGGDGDNVVMMGAHLDGVPGSPAINDNASGSAALLEAAQRLAYEETQQRAAREDAGHRVRFVWWGAEEVRGYPGSRSYVRELEEDDELDTIAAYLNFDMVASPNHVIGVYDARDTDSRRGVPDGSLEVMEVFTDYFDAAGQTWIGTTWQMDSDQVAFVEAGVPTGGLFTGSSEKKTEKQARLFGGEAGRPRDPNYHEPGDDLGNLNAEALGITADAIAHAASRLARDAGALD